MNTLPQNICPILDRCARLGKTGLLLVIMLYLVCYIAIAVNQGNPAELMSTAGPTLASLAALAVVGQLGAAMVRTHLRQIEAHRVR